MNIDLSILIIIKSHKNKTLDYCKFVVISNIYVAYHSTLIIMSFEGVDFEELCAALNVLQSRHEKTEIEELNPVELLKIVRDEFKIKLPSDKKEQELADELWDLMSEKYNYRRHGSIFSLEGLAKVGLVKEEVLALINWKGFPATKDEPDSYVSLFEVPTNVMRKWLSTNLDAFVELYLKASKAGQQNVRTYLNQEELRPFHHIVAPKKLEGVKEVTVDKKDKKKVTITLANDEKWEMNILHAAAEPAFAVELIKALVK